VAEGTTAAALWGRVEVAIYFDHESGNTYDGAKLLVTNGSNYLGSEYGFIKITDYTYNKKWNLDNLAEPSLPPGIMKFYFGGGYWEADVKSAKATK
jgi:hypothetical protein